MTNDRAETMPRFPLAWPMHWRRTLPRDRRRAPFRSQGTALSLAVAIGRLEVQVRLLGARDEILSTNVPLGLRGLPLSNTREPSDPGAALYVKLDGKDLVFACDRWDRVADNVTALASHIDALRRIERYGVGKLEQAFVGYAALPAAADDWRIVLGVGDHATIEQVNAAFIEQAKRLHPDVGGTHDDMARLTAARDLAIKVLSS